VATDGLRTEPPALPRRSRHAASATRKPVEDTMGDQPFADMRQAIIDGDTAAAVALAERALAEGVPPLDAIDRGFVPGLTHVGEQFGAGELYLPDMMLAARAMQKAIGVLEPEMHRQATTRHVRGTVVLGTVKGDIHEIGKNLVGMMLSASGFAVHDLGVDVSPERFVDAAREHAADIVGVSALLTTTMAGQRTVVEALASAGMRPGVRVMVGGAPATAAWAEEIGADGYSEDAIAAVALAQRLMGAPA
jgi:corrinoid protein of di/trimethylamine methyltransferase